MEFVLLEERDGKPLSITALPLFLLVPRILADHPHFAVPTDNLALLANLLDGTSNLHRALHAPRSHARFRAGNRSLG
jgi:hypothetical protein